MSYNRKYYLHRQVRKKEIQLITKIKTIYVTSIQADLAHQNKPLSELRDKYNYSIQYLNPMMTI